MKTHYYHTPMKDDWTTACGRDGRKTGGLIAFFFKVERRGDRCKTCDKQFNKDQREKETNKSTKM